MRHKLQTNGICTLFSDVKLCVVAETGNKISTAKFFLKSNVF